MQQHDRTLAMLARAYWHDYGLLVGTRAQRLAFEQSSTAFDDVQMLLLSDDVAVRLRVLESLAAEMPDSDDKAAAFLAAGPLEEVIEGASPETVDRIIEVLRRNKVLLEAARFCWVRSECGMRVMERVL